ncbi:MAG: hypothetical protein AB7O64_12585 [Methylibium sp.]
MFNVLPVSAPGSDCKGLHRPGRHLGTARFEGGGLKGTCLRGCDRIFNSTTTAECWQRIIALIDTLAECKGDAWSGARLLRRNR